MNTPTLQPGQKVRHIPDGAQGAFERYHPRLPTWVVVRMLGGYRMVTPAGEWEPASDQREGEQ